MGTRYCGHARAGARWRRGVWSAATLSVLAVTQVLGVGSANASAFGTNIFTDIGEIGPAPLLRSYSETQLNTVLDGHPLKSGSSSLPIGDAAARAEASATTFDLGVFAQLQPVTGVTIPHTDRAQALAEAATGYAVTGPNVPAFIPATFTIHGNWSGNSGARDAEGGLGFVLYGVDSGTPATAHELVVFRANLALAGTNASILTNDAMGTPVALGDSLFPIESALLLPDQDMVINWFLPTQIDTFYARFATEVSLGPDVPNIIGNPGASFFESDFDNSATLNLTPDGDTVVTLATGQTFGQGGATPVPAPATFAIFAFGLASLAWARRWCKTRA